MLSKDTYEWPAEKWYNVTWLCTGWAETEIVSLSCNGFCDSGMLVLLSFVIDDDVCGSGCSCLCVIFKCTLIFTFFVNVESFKYVVVPFIVPHQLSIASSLFQFVWPLWHMCVLSILWFGLILEGYGFFFNTGFLTRKRQPPCGYVACSSLMRCTGLRVRILSYSFTWTKKTCYNKECGVEHNLNLSFTLPFATWLLY